MTITESRQATARPADGTARDLLAHAEYIPELAATFGEQIEAHQQRAQRDLYHGGDLHRPRYEPEAHRERVKYHGEQAAAVVAGFRGRLAPFVSDLDTALAGIERERL